jgi:hypothetical protein
MPIKSVGGWFGISGKKLNHRSVFMADKKDARKMDAKEFDAIRTQSIAAASGEVKHYREARKAFHDHVDMVYSKHQTDEEKKDKGRLTVQDFVKKYGTKDEQDKLETFSKREFELREKIRDTVGGVLKNNGLDYLMATELVTQKGPLTDEEINRLGNNRRLFDSIMDGLLYPKADGPIKGVTQRPDIPIGGVASRGRTGGSLV